MRLSLLLELLTVGDILCVNCIAVIGPVADVVDNAVTEPSKHSIYFTATYM